MTRSVNEIKDQLKNIVESQTQVRTNKLKSLIGELEVAINIPSPADKVEGAITPNTDPENEVQEMKTENKYLKRKLTMYDLKIAKLEARIKELTDKK